MGNTIFSETLVEASIVENDGLILRDAPSILREIRRRHITSAEFFKLLRQELAYGLDPERRLENLMETGQFALARRLLRQTGGIKAADLKRSGKEWEDRCSAKMNQVQRRLEAQRAVLGQATVSDIEEMLSEARQSVEELWYDLALEQLDEIEQLLARQIAAATREREERFEIAQDLLKTIRREFMYAEPLVNQQGNTDIVWELLGYADRLSASSDCDLKQIEKLCNMVREICQGAPVNQELISEFKSLYGRPETLSSIRFIAPKGPEVADLTVPPVSTPHSLALEQKPLSESVRAILSELVGDPLSVLQVDLSRATVPPNASWNEDAAKEAQDRARMLRTRFVDEADLSSRAAELLQVTLYLLRYWSERRKNVPEDTRKGLAENLSYYANLQAKSLLHTGHWDAAAEYYRSSLRLRARRKLFFLAEESIFNYFAAYTIQKPVPASHLDKLKGQDINAAQLLLTGLRMAWEVSQGKEGIWLAQGLVKLAAEDDWLQETAQTALRLIQEGGLRDWLGSAFEQLRRLWYIESQAESLDRELEILIENYCLLLKHQDDVLRQLLDATDSIRTLRTGPEIFRELQALDYPWEPTDGELLSGMDDVMDGLSRYFNDDLPFQERDWLADGLVQRDIPFIGRLATSSPTKVGVLYLSRIADNIQLLLEEDQQTLRQVSMPEIEITVAQSEWRPDSLYYCHLNIENLGEARAENVSILVEESPEGEYQLIDESYELGAIYPHQPRSVHIRVRPTPLEETQDAFTLSIRLQYKAPQHAEPDVRSHRLRVDHFAAQRAEFQPIQNPYVVGGVVQSPDLFKGRDQLVRGILTEVANPDRTGSVVIFGQKRSGKSSLLYHVGRQAPSFIIPVLFDIPTILLDLPKVDSTLIGNRAVEDELLGRFLLALALRTHSECQARGFVIRPMSWEELMSQPGPGFQFRQFLEQFRNRQDTRRLLFLFDEFPALLDKIEDAVIDTTIMRLLKSLIEHGYFSCVICGISEFYEVVKRYANQLAVSQPRQVDYLDYEASNELIQDPIRMPDGRSRFYSQQVVDEIIHLTAGSPFYIQLFCHRMVEYMNEEEIERVTAADIGEVTKSLIGGRERLDPVQFDNLYRYKDDPELDDRASTLEGLVIHLLAHETSTKSYATLSALHKHIHHFVSENELDETLGRLDQRRTVIQETDEPAPRRSQRQLPARHYRIRVGLFRAWLLANRPVDDESLHSFERKLRK